MHPDRPGSDPLRDFVGGYSFPSALGRILLSPDDGGGGGGNPPLGQGAPGGGGGGGNSDTNPNPGKLSDQGGDRGIPAPGDRDRETPPNRDASAPPTDPTASSWLNERKQVMAELDRYRREEAKRQSAEREAEQERLKKAGEWEKLETRYQEELRRRDESNAAKDRQYAESILDRDLAVALANFPWVDGGAEAVAKLIRGEVETYEHEGTIRSRSKETFKTLPEYLREKVESDPLLRHLVRAEGRPGSGATDPNRPAGNPADAGRSRNPGDRNEDPAVIAAREFFDRSGRAGSGNSAGYRIG